jgi:phytoene synthase
MNPEDFCRDAAAPPGSSFHYATLFHTAGEQRALYALFALRAEVLRIGTGTPDPGVAAMRRAWWIEELDRSARQQARHPVGIELQRLAERVEIDLPALQNFAAAGGTVPESIDWRDPKRTPPRAAGIWGAAARACSVAQPEAIEAVIRAGELVDRVDVLCAGGSLPEIDVDGLKSSTENLRAALDAASRELGECGAARAEFCLIMTALSAALCLEMSRDAGQSGRVRFALTPLRKLWIAWRVHRRAAAA